MIATDKLRAWQIAPAQHLFELLCAGHNALDASDCGAGKTYVACAVAQALKTPTLVVCPPIAAAQWRNAAAHFGDSVTVIGWEMLRTGNTPAGRWTNPLPPGKSDREFFVCLFCQCRFDPAAPLPCHAHALGIHCVKTKKRKHRYGQFILHSGIGLLIADEAHKASGLDSLNADILIAARRQRIPTLALTATPGTSPLHFRALGFVLGLHNLHDFPKWAAKFGVRRDPTFRALHWPVGVEKQRETMESLNAQIFPARGVRVRKEEIPGFPEVEITSELYDLEAAGDIDAIYREMADELRALEDRAQRDVDPSAAITIMLRAQEKIELIKVPLFADLATDYKEKGISVGIFVNYHATIDALAKRLKTSCIIDGRTKRRQANIDGFQCNSERVILVQTSAGGVALSLQDLHGGHPRGGLVSAGFSAVALQQLFGRFPRDGGKSKSFYRVIFAANTVEEQIHKAVRAKQNNLEALVDGDLLPRA